MVEQLPQQRSAFSPYQGIRLSRYDAIF